MDRPAVVRPGGWRGRAYRSLYPLAFLLPFLTIVCVFFLIPIALTVLMAFTDLDAAFQPAFVGFDNFMKIARDPNVPKVIQNTVFFTLFSLLVMMTASIVLAVATQYLLRGKISRYVYRTLWLMLSAMPGIVYVLFVKWVFDPTHKGMLNGVLLHFGAIAEPVIWFNHWPLAIVIFANAFSSAAGGMILLSAAIHSIPEDYFKAARVDGAGDRAIIADIIVPVLKWPIMYLTISNSISLLSTYYFIMLLTNGGPVLKTTSFSLYAYQTAFNAFKYGYGSAISIFVVIAALLLVLLQMKLFRFDELVKKSRIEM